MFPVAIEDDDVAEGVESFTVSLFGLSGNAVPVGLGSPATVTITDDDADNVTVTLGAASVSEDLTSVTVTATLNVAVQGGFTVLASTSDGDAAAPGDYTALTGHRLTFVGTLGEKQMFPVTIEDDDVAEGVESFTVSLSGLSGNAVPVGLGSPATVTITDDDADGCDGYPGCRVGVRRSHQCDGDGEAECCGSGRLHRAGLDCGRQRDRG